MIAHDDNSQNRRLEFSSRREEIPKPGVKSTQANGANTQAAVKSSRTQVASTGLMRALLTAP